MRACASCCGSKDEVAELSSMTSKQDDYQSVVRRLTEFGSSVESLKRRPAVTPTFDLVIAGAIPVEPWLPSTFLEFLLVERNEENFYFFEEVEALKAVTKTGATLPTDDLLLLPKNVRANPAMYAKEIVKMFVQENAPKEVNISDNQRKAILTKFSDVESQGSDDVHIFSEAQAEVRKLMMQDAWPRFARKMLSENVSPDDSNMRMKKSIFLLFLSLLGLALMLGFMAPRWAIFALTPLNYVLSVAFVASKYRFCINHGMNGIQDHPNAKNAEQTYVIACPIVKMNQKKRLRQMVALVAFLTVLSTGIYFSLTYIIEAGVGRTLYG